jgi:hypothetical protein
MKLINRKKYPGTGIKSIIILLPGTTTTVQVPAGKVQVVHTTF